MQCYIVQNIGLLIEYLLKFLFPSLQFIACWSLSMVVISTACFVLRLVLCSQTNLNTQPFFLIKTRYEQPGQSKLYIISDEYMILIQPNAQPCLPKKQFLR